MMATVIAWRVVSRTIRAAIRGSRAMETLPPPAVTVQCSHGNTSANPTGCQASASTESITARLK